MLTFGSLFAGIGGIDLGLERAGMRCAWQVEIDEYCQKVLTKHWPDVPKFRDVRECGAHNLPPVDLVAGGFPCQDISFAGKRAGITGVHSGLWFEFARIISDLRPRYVLVENVADLLYRGIERVIGDLAAIGYDAEWSVISACAVGAPHTRERMFIVAYPDASNEHGRGGAVQVGRIIGTGKTQTTYKPTRVQWGAESSMGRVAYGVPCRVDRLRGLGNAVVPQVAEWIGRQILTQTAPEAALSPPAGAPE